MLWSYDFFRATIISSLSTVHVNLYKFFPVFICLSVKWTAGLNCENLSDLFRHSWTPLSLNSNVTYVLCRTYFSDRWCLCILEHTHRFLRLESRRHHSYSYRGGSSLGPSVLLRTHCHSGYLLRHTHTSQLSAPWFCLCWAVDCCLCTTLQDWFELSFVIQQMMVLSAYFTRVLSVSGIAVMGVLCNWSALGWE